MADTSPVELESANGGLTASFGPLPDLPVALIRRSLSACGVGQIRSIFSPVSRPKKRGVSRSSRTLGAGCDGRRQRTRRLRFALRTAKSCGPDIPTLISGATRERCHPRRQQSPVSGASTKEPVKTIRAGKAGNVRQTCGDLSACFLFLHAELRVRWRTRLSLRPLFSRVRMFKTRAMPVAGRRRCVFFTSPRMRGEVGEPLAMRSIVQSEPGEGESRRIRCTKMPLTRNLRCRSGFDLSPHAGRGEKRA
jgi:hypothetical protein